METNKISKVAVVGLGTAVAGWLGGIVAVSALLVVSRPSDSWVKIYISNYIGWFVFIPVVAFIVCNLGATVFGSVGYARRSISATSSRAIKCSKTAMIMGSVGLLVVAAGLLFATFRSGF